MQMIANIPPSAFQQADLLLELPVERPKSITRSYTVADVLSFINTNRLADGTFKIRDIRGTITKWVPDVGRLVPEESSRVFELFERETTVVQGHNAAQAWQRVCFRVGGLSGFGRALFLETGLDGTVTLCVDGDLLNIPVL